MTNYILNDLPQQKVSGSTMMHPRTLIGRSLVGVVLVLLGLSAYGCGDSATQTQPAELGSLSVSDGALDPQFNPATTSYFVQLSTDLSSTTITASPRVAGDTIRIDNQPVSSKTVTLDSPGAEESVNIVVTETGTGGTSKSYTVRVKRASLAGNNSLANLTVSPGTLATPFDKDSPNYTVSVANNIERITVTPTLSDPLATMTVNGQPASSGQPSTVDLNGGGQTTTITITVMAQDESTKSYVIAVSRGASSNNNLSGLTVSPGALDPLFRANRPNQTAYTVDVDSGVGSVRVRPTLADTSATMTVNGQTTTSGQSQTIGLNNAGSPTIITIIIIAQNGSPKPYTVTVNRAALGANNNLSALAISPGTLDSPFNANDLSYTVTVGSGVDNVRVRPTLADTTATVTVNGQTVTSGQQSAPITLNPAGQSTSIQIVVIAQNQTAIKNYSVTVVRAALGANNNLSALTISPGTLNSPFNANDLSYTVNVGSTVNSVRVRPTLDDSTATMTVNGQPATSGQQSAPITLNPAGQSTSIQIVVIAQNQTAIKNYSVTAVRAALGANNNLSALTISPGTLDSPFNANDLSYTVNVDSAVESVTVSATKEDPNAVMLIGSVTVPAGTPSEGSTFPLNGAGGVPTPISVTVTAQNGVDVKTYTISVIRPAAPTAPDKPATAPDLITADDSCPLDQLDEDQDGITDECFSGSNDDNFTNVTTPRFGIPQPSAGHTPNLYVDGNKVGSVFDAANNTLQPTTPLSGSNNGIQHSITSTVTSTATNLESQQSDPLPVTISTGQTGT